MHAARDTARGDGVELLTQTAGAAYAIAYVNRTTRLLGDGVGLVREMADLLAGSSTYILAASIKSPEEAVATMKAGAQTLTMPLELLQALPYHPLSESAIAEFVRQGRGIQT